MGLSARHLEPSSFASVTETLVIQWRLAASQWPDKQVLAQAMAWCTPFKADWTSVSIQLLSCCASTTIPLQVCD